MKYQNKRNGKIAIVVETNEKFKTVMLEFEDGTNTVVTTATFKRWYKKIDDVKPAGDVEEVMKQKEELGIDVPEIKPEEVEIVEETEVKKEEKTKEKKERKARTPKDNAEQKRVYDDVMRLVAFNEFDTKVWADFYFSIKFNKKAIAEIRIKRDGKMAIYTRVDTAETCGFDYTVVKNYYLPAVIKNTNIETLKKIFEEVV